MYNKILGIIGVGNMGSALLGGITENNTIQKDKISIYDIDESLLTSRSDEYGVEKTSSLKEIVNQCKNILLAVKPQVISDVLSEISPYIKKDQQLISIAAGIKISFIEEIIGKSIGIIRVMPNTPALVGEGASAFTCNSQVSEEMVNLVKSILESVGEVIEIDEKLLDAVTGLSGSGPAYIFIIIEALSDGGVKMGLSRDAALKLAAQTVLGAARMVLDTKKHPGELKDMVTSPGGTTIAALHDLEKGNLRATLIKAVETATKRSIELGKKQ